MSNLMDNVIGSAEDGAGNSVEEIIQSAKTSEVHLYLKAGKLAFMAAKGKLTAELKGRIVANKADIIAYLEREAIEHSSSDNRITRMSADQAPQLSFAQYRLWFIDQLQGGSAQYNMPAALQVDGDFDVDAAEQAINRIIARHEPLRSVFVGSEPTQVIHQQFDFSLTRHDLTGFEQNEQQSQVDQLLLRDSSMIFDLAADLMVRASYLTLSANRGVLLFNMHHIASDGWSMGILVKEFVIQYQAVQTGDETSTNAALPPLEIQYRDYAHWQRNWLQGEVLENQLNYWVKQLDDLPPVHSLPLDYTRPAIETFEGAMVTSERDNVFSEQLQQVAQVYQITPFMLLHGALALLLSRHSHTKDIVIGTPVANRMQTELTPLIGFFVNTLVLRTDCGIADFGDYLKHIKSVNLQAQAHQDVPFEQLVEHCHVQRSTAHTPLFQIMFTVDNIEQSELVLPGVTFTPATQAQSNDVVAKFDLDLEAQFTAQGMRLSWTYNTSLFSQQTVQRFDQQLNNLLTAVIETDHQTDNQPCRLSELSMLSSQETTQLMDWSQGVLANGSPDELQHRLQAEGLIHRLFEAQVSRTPDAVALVFERQQLSYAQLNARANQVARYLVGNHQLTPDTLVAICVERSLEMVVGIVAILKAGGAYVPIDPDYPADRQQHMLTDSAATVVLTQQSLLDNLPATGQSVICLDSDQFEAQFEAFETHNLSQQQVSTSGQDLAYVIYTSGSTGLPKGVMVEHRPVVQHLAAAIDLLGLTAQDRVFQFASMSFDVFVEQTFAALSVGATLCLRGSSILTADQFYAYCQQHQITVTDLSPLYLAELLADVDGGSFWQKTSLNRVVVGGDVLPDVVAEQWQAIVPPSCRLMNGYGPTETIITTTVAQISEQSTGHSTKVTIGKPLAGHSVYLLDEQQQLVPQGAVSELYIGGECLARGYLNQPELTAKQFINNPFGEGRLYKTGDLVRYLPDGDIAYLGRTDHQVKIRGYRIELGEIEHLLGECDGVASALVLAKQDASGQQSLVAYLVAEGEHDEADLIAGIKRQLKSGLPDYMVPAVFMVIPQWPKTAAGKIDRNALPQPNTSQLLGDYIAPVTDTEKTLTEVWSVLLNRPTDAISTTANFFELGGHSLLAVRLVGEIRQLLNQELSIKDIFATPSIAPLAALIDRGTGGLLRTTITKITDAGDVRPLSFAQQRLWFIDKMQGGSPQYNMPAALRVTGAFDVEAATKALNAIIRRHETLRTVFVDPDGAVHGGDAMQRIVENIEFTLNCFDLRQLNMDEQTRQSQKLVHQDSIKAFDLSADLMLRVSYIRLSDVAPGSEPEQQGILLFNMHHIASDGWSMGILLQEFVQAYQALDSLEPLEIQYADYAQWQRDWLQGEVLDTQLQFWTNQLNDLPVVHGLSLDHTRPMVKGHQGNRVTGHINKQTTTQLLQLAGEHQITPFMLLHAALGLLLARHSNDSNDIVIGTPVANRMQAELNPLIGFFINTLVLRTRSDFTSLSDYLAHVREVNLEALAHQDVQFEQLVEHCQVSRSTAFTPLFQIMFTLDINEAEALALPGLTFSPMSGSQIVAKFDLDITAQIYEGSIELSWVYDTTLFSHQRIEQMSDHLQRLLEGMVKLSKTAPMTVPSQLPLLSEQQTKQQLSELQGDAVNYPQDSLIHELFEAQVKQTPDNLAVVFGEQQLSYRQLNEAANQQAWHLRQQGVGADTLVGLCVERSIEMMIGLLAIIKAGGAYVPLDPTYPAARLQHMLDDAGLKHLLTHSTLADTLLSKQLSIGDDVAVTMLDSHNSTNTNTKINNPERTSGQHSGNLAYVIYTSGSTGLPKGVTVEHGNLHSRLAYLDNLLSLTSGDTVPSIASFAFDISLAELVYPLTCGAGLDLLATETIKDVSLLAQRIKGSCFIHMVPGLAQLWLDEINSRDSLALQYKAQQDNPLQYFATGGDAVPPALLTALAQALPHTQILQFYGPTEASLFGVCQTDAANNTASMGKPIDNTQVYLLDSHDALVPFGTVGQLHIGGAGVTRGYLNRAELTAQQFIASPFHPQQRLYRTGDLARYLPDGSLTFMGRMDDQVKIRGFRVELGEIEQQLTHCAGVASAIVMVSEERLLAYLLMADVEAFDRVDVEAGLKQHLPEHMIPSAFVPVTAWPLTANGKIDKKALPKPDDSLLQGETICPETTTEQALTGIWAELLKLPADDISVVADFFALGGHSLLAVRLIAQIRSTFTLELPVKTIFDAPTVRQLAAKIDAGSDAVLRTAVTRIPRQSNLLPLSFAQQRLWFIDYMAGGSAEYNMPMALQVDGVFDIDVAVWALRQIIERHESLRTVFVKSDDNDQPLQMIVAAFDFKLTEHDLRHLDKPEQAIQSQQLVQQDSLRSFDLSLDVMIRASFLHLAENCGILLLNLHHIASDGWSMGLLVKEFASLYQAGLKGEPSPLPALEIQYADYAQWQRQWLSGEVLQQQLDYWHQQLAGVEPVHALPLDYPRPEVKQHQGEVVTGQLSPDIARQLQQLAARHQITPFMLLHGMFALLLSRHSNSSDIVIGTPVANRMQSELADLIGFFVNTQVLRANTAFDSLDDYLADIKHIHLAAQDHQDVPFEQLVELCGVPRSTAHTPLFQILFSMAGDEQVSLDLPGLTFTGVSGTAVVAKFDLDLNASINEQGILLTWTYDKTLFKRATIRRLDDHLRRLLEAVAVSSAATVPATNKLADLPILSAAELQLNQQLNQQLNLSADIKLSAALVHQLFETRAAQWPNNTAVVYLDETLNYQDLNQAANRLAHYLRAQGVVTDTLVGLCLNRSVDLVIAVLAILKAGGAYVPLDPNYPQQRLLHMINDSGIKQLLTTSDISPSLPLQVSVQVIKLDNLSQTLSGYASNNPTPLSGQGADSLAYVNYTSGSTGLPKGVMIPHQAVTTLVDEPNFMILDQHSRFLQVASISFDAATVELWGPLSNGGCCVIYAPAQVDLHHLNQLIARHHINGMLLTAGLFEQWSHSVSHSVGHSVGQNVDQSVAALPSLKTVLAGGDVVNPLAVNRVLTALPGVQVVNAYGPTENTMVSSCHVMTQTIHPSTAIPIGRASNGCVVMILAGDKTPTPQGCVGELYVGGAGLARGYLNRPELNLERFINYNLPDGTDIRLYRTGDLVSCQPDGTLDFVGRADNQVKIRGFRIEPGEIEQQLLADDAVTAALVLVREDIPGHKTLVAYLLAESDAVIAPLQQRLQHSLPDYMQPSAYVVLAQWPLTNNGKINRNALPAPTNASVQGEYIAAATPTELALTTIWTKLLNQDISKLGVSANFFDLGGHSLLAVQLVSQVQRELDVLLAVKDLFSHPVLVDLAACIDAGSNGEADYGVTSVSGPANQLPPLFIAPALGMMGVTYQALAQSLATSFDVMVLTTPGIDEVVNSDSALLTLGLSQRVERWFKAIKAVQPSGHYRLMGHSFGGDVAFELAYRLEQAGDSVEVILLDSVLATESAQQQGDGLSDGLADLLLPGSKGTSDGMSDDVLYQQLLELNLLPASVDKVMFAVYCQAARQQLALFKGYQPSGQLTGSVTLVQASAGLAVSEHRLEVVEHIQSWCEQALTVSTVDGDHLSVLNSGGLVRFIGG